ncbi:MAG: Two component regulator three Y domain protein, partial [Candidatus Aminicenantes bacterium]|nr:Two component regulator three Y domain protein [Candidatus Aminicenantes bacterium]NIM82557.1 Two component regulator three Y domain protein [Candidatus Aminicenantes bacterium]NIN21917.1 Two component regulator three Y domain protein [Candidatus Aminicenantes bacterium]NIN45695.1 Two component regulator three Y domain protein [Candidatus Aminicenantes bacterium]NIN88530.1 Two component regulator three Y domain protein [Candidatus Aminicenantes bacterium]
ASPVNTWHGVTCNQENTTVIRIELAHNQLKGKLPHGLSKLSNLESLVLNNNQLESLHEAMGNLSKLTILNL